MAKYKVLSTKKLGPSLIEKARENDIEIIEQEFISIQRIWNKETHEKILAFPKQGLYTAAITSANAVSVLNDYMLADDDCHIIAWNFYCLQGRTKQAIQTAPLLDNTVIAGEAANAFLLADEIISKGIKEIIFFCGDKRRDDLPSKLREAEVNVHEVMLYETIRTPVAVGNDFDAILFFSPTGVQSFFAVNELMQGVVCFAIGPTTSNNIKSFTTNPVVSSVIPDPKVIIDEVIEHFKHRSTVG
jgi:uroporphyrinogen-III synthase